MHTIVLIAHNLRSAHNVGSLLRTAEGLGVAEVYLTGYTPYPAHEGDSRLPHISKKVDAQIAKTALGAESFLKWRHVETIEEAMAGLRNKGYSIAALEQSTESITLQNYEPPESLALVVGREVEGLEPEVLAQCDNIIEIPMHGRKESFNVVQASAMALYHLSISRKS